MPAIKNYQRRYYRARKNCSYVVYSAGLVGYFWPDIPSIILIKFTNRRGCGLVEKGGLLYVIGGSVPTACRPWPPPRSTTRGWTSGPSGPTSPLAGQTSPPPSSGTRSGRWEDSQVGWDFDFKFYRLEYKLTHLVEKNILWTVSSTDILLLTSCLDNEGNSHSTILYKKFWFFTVCTTIMTGHL